MKQVGRKEALQIFVGLERVGIIWNGFFTVHDICAETFNIHNAFGGSTLNPCAVFRSIVVLKSCFVMSCWNLHTFSVSLDFLLLFLQVSLFFLCVLVNIIMQLIFITSAKKHTCGNTALSWLRIIVQNCSTNVTNDAA